MIDKTKLFRPKTDLVLCLIYFIGFWPVMILVDALQPSFGKPSGLVYLAYMFIGPNIMGFIIERRIRQCLREFGVRCRVCGSLISCPKDELASENWYCAKCTASRQQS